MIGENPIKHVERLAQSYIYLLLRFGLVRSSLLVALTLGALVVVFQVGIHWALVGSIDNTTLSRIILFCFIFTPCLVYFFSCVVSELAESRQNYCDVIMSLEEKSEKLEKARAALAEQTSLLGSFIDASPDLIYYRNEQGQFLRTNKAMAELTGKTQRELMGLTVWDIYSESAAAKVDQTDKIVLETEESVTYEQWLYDQNCREICFEMSKVPLYSEKGDLLGLVGFGRNITEHKSTQNQLAKASQDKTTFISTISHELRTPLNAIVGFSRQLLDTKLDAKQQEQLRIIYISAVTLGQIFNGIIDLDKAGRGKLEQFPEYVNLMELISGIELIGRLMAEQAKLSFNFDLLSSIPEAVLVDVTRLRQILWNLLSNAFKFTRQGAVNINLSCEVIGEQALLEFNVEDSGIGISEQEQKNIFTMYYQVTQDQSNLHATGTGIGLAISKQNAELMGGELSVESELGFGSTFTLRLPAPICDIPDKQTHMNIKKASYHLLLVEDIELNIAVATSYLEKLGHSVVVARTGKEALSLFAEQGFDLVFLDIQLPDMTGFEVAKTLRKRYSQLPPLIALTANAINDKKQYIEKGMDDALTKPFTIESISRAICTAITPAKVSDASPNPETNSSTVLDLVVLSSYIEITGVDALNKNVKLFEELIAEYLVALDNYLIAEDIEGIISEAHRIKSAASAVGLKRIQALADKAQQSERAGWWHHIDGWVNEIKNNYQSDIDKLNTWLSLRV